MRNYAKIGKRAGLPAYRTAATFRFRKYLKIAKVKISDARQAKKREF
jgi:hypothetical protein